MIVGGIDVLRKHFVKIIKLMQIIKLCQEVCHFEWREEVDVKSKKKEETGKIYSQKCDATSPKPNFLIIYFSFP